VADAEMEQLIKSNSRSGSRAVEEEEWLMRKVEQLTKAKQLIRNQSSCSKGRTADLEQNILSKRKIADTQTARRLYV
jgi:hypothetical protein